MAMLDETLRERGLAVHRRLLDLYGEPQWRPHLEPIGELVSTILSQNTNDVNRDRAFAELRARFPTWEAVRDADLAALKASIRVAGLANQKAPSIQRALRQIDEARGELSLDFLRDLPIVEAKAWLTAIKGVGPKTAAIVLLFSLGRPAFPVDTHVHRVSGRIGLIEPGVSREQAHEMLEAMMPPETFYALHLNLIRHGREVCAARRPRCDGCALRDLCAFGSAENAQ